MYMDIINLNCYRERWPIVVLIMAHCLRHWPTLSLHKGNVNFAYRISWHNHRIVPNILLLFCDIVLVVIEQ